MRELEPSDPRSAGRFRLLARAGSGGMAVVYFGRSAGGRPVAVKMAHAEFAADLAYRERFRHEVLVTRAVTSPYSPGLLDADPDATRPWLATEFLPALSLRDLVRRFGPLPPDAAWSLAAGLAEALAPIHRAGFVHLDLKPSNVLITLDGPRIIDFGIARPLDTPGSAAGSPGFMSPEQETGAATGPASDVYSLGRTLADSVVPDAALRALISACADPDPAARPDLRDLSARPAPAPLPPPVLAELGSRITEAQNRQPPTPAPLSAPRPPQRRAVLLAVLALVVVLGAVAVILAMATSGTARSAPPPPRPVRTSSAAPSTTQAAARSQTLEIFLTGTVPVTSFTYTVGDKATTLTNLTLPWRTAVAIPQLGYSLQWSIQGQHPNGTVSYQVTLDREMIGYGGDSGTGFQGHGLT